jgi:predicted Zn-dependent protease
MLKSCCAILFAGLAAVTQASPWLEGPPASELAFPQTEIDAIAAQHWRARLQRDADAGLLGCRRHCARIGAVFERVVRAADDLLPALDRRWQLGVSVNPREEAWALPGGHVYISEAFIDAFEMDDAQLAFVLAHELGHVLLDHENQALTIAHALLPHGVTRTVSDMYAHFDYDLGLALKLTPELQTEEFEADRAAMLIGAIAGYPPAALLGFLQQLAERDGRPASAADVLGAGGHPAPAQRLERARVLLDTAGRAAHAFADEQRP